MVKEVPVSVSTSFHLPRETVSASGVTGPLERSPRPRGAEGQFSPEQGSASVLAAGWEPPWAEGVPLTGLRVLTSQHPTPPAGGSLVIPESQPLASPSFGWRRRRGPAQSPTHPAFSLGLLFPVSDEAWSPKPLSFRGGLCNRRRCSRHPRRSGSGVTRIFTVRLP